MVQDALESTLALSHDVNAEGVPNGIPAYIFDKGASIIRMMQHILGQYRFVNGIRKYLKFK